MPRIIIYSNLLPIIGLVVLFFLIHKNPLFHRRQNRLFQIAVAVTLVMLVAVSADYIFVVSDNPAVWPFRTFTTFLNFGVAPIVPLLLYNIFTVKEPPLWLYVPCAVNFALCALSIKFGWVFFVTDSNTYFRGILFFVPFLFSLFYVVVLLLGSGKQRQKGKKSERFFLLFVIALLVFTMILEITLSYKFLAWDSAAVSLILYYLLLNINNAVTDALTGALNRPMFTAALTKASANEDFAVATLDINDFKKINDDQGHDMGDRCLQIFTQTVTNSLPKKYTLYRIGGDEFAVICTGLQEKKKFAEVMEACRNAVQAVHIDFSYGIAFGNRGDNIKQILYDSDQAMYEHKRQIKEQAGFTHR